MMLQAQGVSKRFGGLQALTDVTFEIEEGMILGLIGPNGAGKTTLFNCINGVYPPDGGKVTFQVVRPLNELSVRDNVIVGACYGREAHSRLNAGKVADEVLERVGLAERADMLASSLNVAQKKRLEMARALAARPYLLLLDEVLAGLNPTEVARMVDTIRRIREEGTTIFMIEHLMHAVMNLSDHVVVLDYGKVIARGAPQEISTNPQVIEAYLGDPKLAQELLGEA